MSTESGACVQSALAIVEGMKSLGGQGCIGVTTGQLLCACVGSRIRAEYTVFGDSINLSARLMCKATAGMGDILCDYSTHHMAPAAATYTRLEPLVVLPCPPCSGLELMTLFSAVLLSMARTCPSSFVRIQALVHSLRPL